MSIDQFLKISIVEFLASLGIKPISKRGNKYWYLSPFRKESKPSFKVNVNQNLWYDFGEGKGGGIVSLAKRLYRTDDTFTAMRCVETHCPMLCVIQCNPVRTVVKDEPAWKDVRVFPLSTQSLREYYLRRGILPWIAEKYCKEVSYTLREKRYFSMAFPNNSGGYELRNAYFKGCMGKKDITVISGENVANMGTKSCHVFEGFFDFLSFLVLLDMGKLQFPLYGKTDYIILNSVSNLGKVLKQMDHYDRIFVYLDQDQAGRAATETIAGVHAHRVLDLSLLYMGHNDLNEYLVSLISNKRDETNTSVPH